MRAFRFCVSFGLRWVLPVSFRPLSVSPSSSRGLSLFRQNARPVFPVQIGFAVSLAFGLLFAFLHLTRFAGCVPFFRGGVRVFPAVSLRPSSRFSGLPVSRPFSRVPFGCPAVGGVHLVSVSVSRWFLLCPPCVLCPVFARCRFCRFSCAVSLYKERAGAGGFFRNAVQKYYQTEKH